MTCGGCNNTVPLTVGGGYVSDPQERWRRKQYWLAARVLGCMRCPLQRRWLGLDWCGEPSPLRIEARAFAKLSDAIRYRRLKRLRRVRANRPYWARPRRPFRARDRGRRDGCGCILNIKRQLENASCPLKKWGPMLNIETPTVKRNARGHLLPNVPGHGKAGSSNGSQNMERRGIHRFGLLNGRQLGGRNGSAGGRRCIFHEGVE